MQLAGKSNQVTGSNIAVEWCFPAGLRAIPDHLRSSVFVLKCLTLFQQLSNKLLYTVYCYTCFVFTAGVHISFVVVVGFNVNDVSIYVAQMLGQ